MAQFERDHEYNPTQQLVNAIIHAPTEDDLFDNPQVRELIEKGQRSPDEEAVYGLLRFELTARHQPTLGEDPGSLNRSKQILEKKLQALGSGNQTAQIILQGFNDILAPNIANSVGKTLEDKYKNREFWEIKLDPEQDKG